MKQEFTQESHENDDPSFVDKLKSLLPDVEFKESDDMLEARTAILQALVSKIPIFYQLPGMNTPIVHKALIFREAGNTERYFDELFGAEEYAAGMILIKFLLHST